MKLNQDVATVQTEWLAWLWLATLIVCSIALVVALVILRQRSMRRNYQQLQATLKKLDETEQLNHLILQTLPDLVWLKDINGVFMMCNSGVEDLLDAAAHAIIGKTDFDFFDPYLAGFFRSKDLEAMEKGYASVNDEWLHFARTGKAGLFETIKTPVHNKMGDVIGVMGIARDLTARHAAEKAHRASEERLRTLGDNLPQGYVFQFGNRSDGQTYFSYLSAGVESIHGVSVREVYDNAYALLSQIDNTQLQAYLAAEQRSACDMTDFIFDARMVRKDGEARWVQMRSRPQRLQNGDIVWDGLALDITQQKQQEEKLRLAARVFSDAHEGIIITDTQYRIVDVNPIFCEITGYDRRDLIGRPSQFIRSSDLGEETLAGLRRSLFRRGFWSGDIINQRKNGETYIANMVISAVRDNLGEITNYIGLMSDVTQAKEQQKFLEMMAHYDPLTRLPNRVLLLDRFNTEIARAKREKTQLAVCYLDLDGFKLINDHHGHELGDKLLVEVANRIQSCLREEDTVSRIGGDEFALLMGSIRSSEQFEQGIKRIHQSICQPYIIDQKILSVGASTGVTLYPQDDADPETLLRHADQAMYRAKQDGRNRFCCFDLSRDNRANEQRELFEQLRQALQTRQLCLYYQPKVNIRTGEVLGLEALLRWHHTDRGLLLPADFLPAIIGTPLEQAIGEWVIEEALQQLDFWRRVGLQLKISVNISPRHLLQQDFQQRLSTLLARYPSELASDLEIEVLENSVLDDLSSAGRVIRNCRSMAGIEFTLDDFGTGYSSLSHIRQLPVNTIKIDQSFVRDMMHDEEVRSLVEGVIALARAFQRDVVAEGVETDEHRMALLHMGCELAQGYAIAHPMPANSVQRWLDSQREPKAAVFSQLH